MSESNENDNQEKPRRRRRAPDKSGPPDDAYLADDAGATGDSVQPEEAGTPEEPKPVRRRAPRSANPAVDKPRSKKPAGEKPARKPAARKPKTKQRGGLRALPGRLLAAIWAKPHVKAVAFGTVLILIVVALLAPTLMRWLHIGPSGAVAPLFTPEVQYWSASLSRWAQDYGVDANLLATLMQIESCGYPGAASGAGAQGLFQVMPMHFTQTENMTDPETNAKRGVGVIVDCLKYADGDAGLAMACYNGGPSLISRPQSDWPLESQHYYNWGLGIYTDAARGASHSDSLDNWLASGGIGLCQRAAEALGLPAPQAVNIPTSSGVQPTFPPTAIPPTQVPVLPTFAVVSPVNMPTLEGLPTYSAPNSGQ